MKRMLAAAGLASLLSAQILPLLAAEQKIACNSVPAAALDAFKATYPKAVVKGCAKEIDKGKVAYEFSSEEGKTRRDVVYSDDGKLMVAEERIHIDAAPDAVKAAVTKKHPKGKVTLAEKLTGPGGVKYEFRVKTGGKEVEVVFDEQGKEVEP